MTDRAMSDETKPCVIWECIYDHGNGKFMGDASKAQRERAFAELRRLHAEVDALRADAERYRWLRDGQRIRQGVPVEGGRREIKKSPLQSLMSFNYWCDRKELDDAIDAASKEST